MSARVVVGKVDVFDPKFDVRIIPVNCVGAMGKGLAKEAARRYPETAALYRKTCRRRDFWPGEVIAYAYPGSSRIWFAATKDHWRAPSKAEWAVSCCRRMAEITTRTGASSIRSIAVPALGCGLGGLSFDEHRAAFVEALEAGRDGVTFYLSPPGDP